MIVIALTEPFDNSDAHLLAAWAHLSNEEVRRAIREAELVGALGERNLKQRRRVLELRSQ